MLLWYVVKADVDGCLNRFALRCVANLALVINMEKDGCLIHFHTHQQKDKNDRDGATFSISSVHGGVKALDIYYAW